MVNFINLIIILNSFLQIFSFSLTINFKSQTLFLFCDGLLELQYSLQSSGTPFIPK